MKLATLGTSLLGNYLDLMAFILEIICLKNKGWCLRNKAW